MSLCSTTRISITSSNYISLITMFNVARFNDYNNFCKLIYYHKTTFHWQSILSMCAPAFFWATIYRCWKGISHLGSTLSTFYWPDSDHSRSHNRRPQTTLQVGYQLECNISVHQSSSLWHHLRVVSIVMSRVWHHYLQCLRLPGQRFNTVFRSLPNPWI